jgi:small subunit ribosomal protein S9
MITPTKPTVKKPGSTRTTHAKVDAKRSPAPMKGVRYAEGVGRRKTAIARVRITPGTHAFVVNNRSLHDYFGISRLEKVVASPLAELHIEKDYAVHAHVRGGGVAAQAEAVRHGLARALVKVDGELKKRLRKFGFLTRDSRMVERKKYGLKKARRGPQWAKR